MNKKMILALLGISSATVLLWRRMRTRRAMRHEKVAGQGNPCDHCGKPSRFALKYEGENVSGIVFICRDHQCEKFFRGNFPATAQVVKLKLRG